MKNKTNRKELLNRGNLNSTPEIKTVIKIIIGIVLFLVVVYFLGGLVTGNIKLKKESKEVEIQYSEILAEQTFKLTDTEYFVIYYDFSSNESSFIEALSSDLSKNISIYKVDLNKKFNENYVTSGSSNKKPNSVSDLKINGITLIRIKNGKVIKYVEGLNNIKEYTLGL